MFDPAVLVVEARGTAPRSGLQYSKAFYSNRSVGLPEPNRSVNYFVSRYATFLTTPPEDPFLRAVRRVYQVRLTALA